MKNIIFDIDRTLVDSSRVEGITFKQAMLEVTGRECSSEEIAIIPYVTTTNLFISLGITDKDTQDKISKRWGALLDANPVPCFPGIIDLVKKFHDDNTNMYIVTSRTKQEFKNLCRGDFRDIIDYFINPVTSDLVKNPKPNPDYLLKVIKDNDLDPDETIYIGDDVIDSKAVANANNELDGHLRFGYATWDKHANDDEFVQIDYRFDKPEDIEKVVKSKDLH